MNIHSSVHIEAWRCAFSELPEEVSIKFTDEERSIYERGSAAIIERLESIGEATIDQACGMFKKDQPFHVYIEDFLSSSPSIWFGLSSIKLERQILLMARREVLPVWPGQDRLTRLFSAVGAIKSGELYSAVLQISKGTWEGEDNWTVIAYGNGDRLVLSAEGTAYLIDHESLVPYPVSLHEYIDDFLSIVFSIRDLFRE